MSQSTQTHVRIRPESGWLAFRLSELWAFRDVLVMLAARDVRLRYNQTALGVLWVILQPLAAGLIFTVIFGRFVKLPTDGCDYLPFVFSGLVAWQLFAGILQRAGGSMVSEARLVTKVYFPRLLVPLAGAAAVLLDFLISAVVMVVLVVGYGIHPGWNLLWLPMALMLTLMLAVGSSLWLAALNMRYRDFLHATPFLIQVWMYATPVVYSASVVPVPMRGWFALNPMVGIVELFRRGWLGLSHEGDGAAVLLSCLLSAGVLFTGIIYFQRVESELVDRL